MLFQMFHKGKEEEHPDTNIVFVTCDTVMATIHRNQRYADLNHIFSRVSLPSCFNNLHYAPGANEDTIFCECSFRFRKMYPGENPYCIKDELHGRVRAVTGLTFIRTVSLMAMDEEEEVSDVSIEIQEFSDDDEGEDSFEDEQSFADEVDPVYDY